MCRIPVGVFAQNARGILARLDGYRLVNHTGLIGVISHFDMTGNWEVLAERMADETVIGQNPAQIVMTDESDAVQVERFAFEPINAFPDASDRINRGKLIILGEDPDTQAPVMLDRKQVRNRGEAPPLPGTFAVGRVIDATEIDQFFKMKIRLVPQRSHHRQIVGSADFDGYFTQSELERLELVTKMLL